MKLRCIIADDEKGARLILENYIERLDHLQLDGSFRNVLEVFNYLKTHSTDILLLDINMPEIDGFGLLDMLPQQPCVVFTTAYSDYALKGFEYNAVDYLKKPIRFERFVVAMDKAARWCNAKNIPQHTEVIHVRIDGRDIPIRVREIYYAESLGNYIKIHTDSQAHLVLMTMHELEQMLPVTMFVRIHKSFLINAKRITKTTAAEVVMDDITLPVGNTYKKYFSTFLKLLG